MGANMSLLSSTLNPGNAEPCLYVFGYGSLIWNPGFKFDQQETAVARGYSRRFYQGNTTFRGNEELPGRVVTLVEEADSHTYGIVFKITGRRNVFDALEHLYEREIENGYTFQIVPVQCIESGQVWEALTCIAFEKNTWFLGPPVTGVSFTCGQECQDHENCHEIQTQRRMAWEIANARGTAGPNYEYLLKLADAMRKLFPDVIDEHLYQLEMDVLSFLKDSSPCNERAPSVFCCRSLVRAVAKLDGM